MGKIISSTDKHIQFSALFGKNPEVRSKAPGRLEILGNHTDYNQGAVMSMAIDRYTTIFLCESSGQTCRIASPQIEESIREFNLDQIREPLSGKDWMNYIRGCVFALQEHGYDVAAFDALITSNIPLSAGVSSSAALEMALITGLDTLFELNIPLEKKAKLGQFCENHYIKANTGLMDQLTSLAGKANQLLISEYKNLGMKYTPFPEELSIVILNSHVEHDLSQEYNERREQCIEAFTTLQVSDSSLDALCDSSLENLFSHKDKMSPLAYSRALHVLGEHERVSQASELICVCDYIEFGQLLFDSHDSSKQNFENSCPELDTLVAYAQNSDLCLGARLSGGGFGGISIHIVLKENAEEYKERATAAFLEFTGISAQSFICNSADGASAQLI